MKAIITHIGRREKWYGGGVILVASALATVGQWLAALGLLVGLFVLYAQLKSGIQSPEG